MKVSHNGQCYKNSQKRSRHAGPDLASPKNDYQRQQQTTFHYAQPSGFRIKSGMTIRREEHHHQTFATKIHKTVVVIEGRPAIPQ